MIRIVRTISFRLAIIVSIIFSLLMVGVEVFSYFEVMSEVEYRTNQEQLSLSRHYAGEIRVKIHNRRMFIAGLADSLTSMDFSDRSSLDEVLRSALKMTDFFEQGLGIIRPDGSGLFAEYPVLPKRKELNYHESRWFERALSEDGVVISAPFRSRYDGKPIVVFAKALRRDNRVLGVLAAPIPLSSSIFIGFAYDTESRPHGDVLIISRTDRIFVASSTDMVMKPTPEKGINKLHDRNMEGYNGVGRTVAADGVEMLSAIADVGEPDWYVVVRTPTRIVFRPIRERLATNLFSTFILCGVLAMVIFFTLRFYFTPLRNAARKVRQMGDDRRPLEHLEQAGKTEIGDLVSGFNSLVDTVRERNSRLEKISQTDGLTGVCNRRCFDQCLDRSWRAHRRNTMPLSLIFIDIDLFKKYNDYYGHQQGDACLAAIAQTLSGILKRSLDVFARYGGEEFAAILESDTAGAISIAEFMRRAVEDLNIDHADSPFGRVTISLGVATVVPGRDGSPQELIALADAALYESKDKGRNRICVYNPDGAG